MNGFGILTAQIAVPLAGALALMLVPNQFGKAIRWLAMLFSIASFGVSLAVLSRFTGGTYQMQMTEAVSWIEPLGIHYRLGIDGVSLWLVILTTFLNIIAVWFSFYVKERVKTFFVMVMVLLAAMLGVFLSLDLILFYVFFEASLIPMAVMIWVWGGSKRNYAAIKFFIYTFGASIFMLLGIITVAALHRNLTGNLTFDLVSIQKSVASGALWAQSPHLQAMLFWSFAVAFMVKCPVFPFHTWLPDAHTEAPTAGSVILAGVLLKMGTYGFLRICLPLFPEATIQAALPMTVLAVVGILYGAAVAAMQPDVKRLVAYSSVAHMGFVVLGIFSLNHVGIVGGAYQQLSHGVSTGALFLLIGLLYERIHTRLFADMGGLKAQMPIFAALFLVMMLSSVGLPGLNGFVGEFMAMLGAFQSGIEGAYGLNLLLPILASIGVVLAAVYLLWMFQKVFYGPVTNPVLHRLKDLKTHEVVMVGFLLVAALWGGLYPSTFLGPMDRSLAAARLMATGAPGERPTWDDESNTIAEDGTLIVQTDGPIPELTVESPSPSTSGVGR
ncbi:MAG: NuoM family protein [Fimbriimonadaceae bacterium]